MNLTKKIIAAALALSFVTAPVMALSAEEAFPAVKPYPGYADVPAGSWFEPGAKLCYEVGLITGSDRGFEPERNMLLAEVAAIAARMAAAVTGEPIPSPGPDALWYVPYVDYLTARGVTGLEQPQRTATRADFLAMLAAVLPGGLLSPINTITALPDSADPAVLYGPYPAGPGPHGRGGDPRTIPARARSPARARMPASGVTLRSGSTSTAAEPPTT